MTSALTFDAVAHRYQWRGAEVPYVSQILTETRVAPPYPAIDNGRKEFGSWVHKCCERLLQDRLEMCSSADAPERYPGTRPRTLWPYLDAFRAKVDEYKIKTISTEQPVYNDVRVYAGTLDLHCKILDGEEAIIDYKTGQPPACTALQLAAYDAGLNRTLGLPERHRPRRRFAMYLLTDATKETGKAKMIEFTDPEDYTVFFALCTIWHYQHRKGR